MIPLSRWPVFALLVVVSSATRVPDLPSVQPNPNLKAAGVLHHGVLTVALEAKYSAWHLYGPGRRSMTIEAFSEPGEPPLLPGPLVRVPRGTEIRVSVRNSLPLPLTFLLPAAIRGGPDKLAAMDSVVVAPGAVGVLTTLASVPGNYVYRATTPTGASKVWRIAGLLGGGVVVDTATTAVPPHDRVFVIMESMDSAFTAALDSTNGVMRQVPAEVKRNIYTINGASWPHTERIAATVGDSLHWRMINATLDMHPMHLHGFYYRVDLYSGPFADGQGPLTPGQMVVTQLMGPFSAMSISWSPDRPGNWLFHCHFAFHLQPDARSAAPDDPGQRGMTGLAFGVSVAGRPGARAPGRPAAVRHLRLIAVAESLRNTGTDGGLDATPLHQFVPDSVPSLRFILEEHGRRTDTERDFSPEIDLTRGVPVSITIVNHLNEPTSVHWHGIEIEDSYADGVPGFSGTGRHLSPEIAPGDSFEARFTPPRSGTFMYHAHVDEVREQLGGLEGALIVRDPGDTQSTDDHVFFLKGLGKEPAAHPFEINGATHPDTVVLHSGRPARFRFLNLATAAFPSFWLTARRDTAAGTDTMAVIWRPVAKDGFDLPTAARTPRSAHQMVAMGETYDFEYTPQLPGMVYLEVRGGTLLKMRIPIRIE